ncbi:MAG: hypothetical protein AABY40_04775 [Nanoarchaeota archaeon]
MRLSVIYSNFTNRNGLPQKIQIIATSWLRKVGSLEAVALSDQNEYVVYVESYQPGKGIARTLLAKINDVFEELAKKKKVVIQDIVKFLNEEAEMKLENTYLKLGYTQKGKILAKTFRP